jgi:hypothetical protein
MSRATIALPLAPMTANAAISAFNYLWAVQTAARFATEEPPLPALLVDVAERIVIPVDR